MLCSCTSNRNEVDINEINNASYRIEEYKGGLLAYGYYEIVKKTKNEKLSFDEAKLIFRVSTPTGEPVYYYSIIFHYLYCDIVPNLNGSYEYIFTPRFPAYNSFIVNKSGISDRKVVISNLDIKTGEEWHIDVYLGYKRQY